MAEKPPVFLKRTRAGFEPAYGTDEHMLDEIPVGTIVSAQLRRPRSPRRHRWWWALCSLVAQNHPFYATGEQVSTHLKFRCGLVDPIVLQDGRVLFIPQSISFAKMDETAFARFVDNAVGWVVKELLPGVEEAALRKEIEEMLQ